MTEFKPGDMVECVDDGRADGFVWGGQGPVSGGIYTVREVCLSHRDRQPSLRLVEIRRDPWDQLPDAPYYVHRFRLIRPPAQSTDITALTEIVRKVFAGGKVSA